MRVTDTHVYFWGGRYSNFYGCSIIYALTEGLQPFDFNCSEQIFMAHKALHFNDEVALDKILKSCIPREQKAIGRTVVGFDPEEWSKVSYDYMYRAVYQKFKQNPELSKHLSVLGGRRFVEASPLDRVWGVGLAEEDDLILDEKNWKGTNWLGKVIDQVFDKLTVERLTQMDAEIQ